MMADVRGFRGLYYNPAKVPDLSQVISLPYDVISPEHRREYAEQSPHNVVHLILPEGQEPYQEANRLSRQWIDEGILIQDQQPTIYIYQQTFKNADGEEKTRTGFLARIRIEDFEKGIVLPHEATLFAPKEDRLKLLRAAKINFSPIFSLYSDPAHEIDSILTPFTSAPPRFSVTDENGVVNRLWAVRDPAAVQKIQEFMKKHWVLIADGHHRYESCIVYRDEMSRENKDPEAPFQFTLMYFCNIHQPGIAISPYNRAIYNLPSFNADEVLKKAEPFFEIQHFENADRALQTMREYQPKTAFSAFIQGKPGAFVFLLRQGVDVNTFYTKDTPEAVRSLDVNILHKLFLERILGISEEDVKKQTYLKYYKDLNEERRDFESGKLQITFFLNPTRVEQVVDAAKAGAKMPQKSTYFYPKLMTGFVMNKHD
jgi:uncharacterized protein (DUF1015 family)